MHTVTDKSAVITMFQCSNILDTSREDIGVITISQSTASLGVIESANTVALNMFGYSKRSFVGKNISVVIPRPFSDAHGRYLQAFLETGREVCPPA